MKEVVSASLGSSKRDHEAEVELLGERLRLRRIGTDGDFGRAIELLRSLDGKVDAIGLGGIDIYLYAGDGRRYAIRDARKLVRAVTKTPLVDGSGLKNTLERQVVAHLADVEELELQGKRVLMVSAVDRFGLAASLVDAGCRLTFGDLIFGLGIPIPIRSFAGFKVLARLVLPVVTRMPFKMLYPTGSKQEREPDEKYARHYREADIIAGDFLFIRKHMPRDMRGKWLITNTTTADDVKDLKERGVALLVTTTPEFGGRSFGTNVLEAAFVALLGKAPEDITPGDYLELLRKLDYKPRVEWLNQPLSG